MCQTLARGYTLAEIVTAVAVMAILVTAMTPLVFRQIERSRDARCRADLEVLKGSFVQYHADTGLWPCGWNAETSPNLQAPLTDNVGCLYADDATSGWDGPYLEESGGVQAGRLVLAADADSDGNYAGVVDPWGHPFHVFAANAATPGAALGTVTLYSAGKDGVVDTSPADLLRGLGASDDIVTVVRRKARD